MKTKYVYLFSPGIFILAILFDAIRDQVRDIAGSQMNYFISTGAGLLLNLLFFIPLAWLVVQFLNQPRSIAFRWIHILIGLFLLLLSIPPLWNLPIPIEVLLFLQLPASPLSYVGIACSFMVAANLLGLLIHPSGTR